MMSNVDPPLKSSSLTLQINVEIKRVVLLLVVRRLPRNIRHGCIPRT